MATRAPRASGPDPAPRVAFVAPPADFVRGIYGFRTKQVYRNQPPLGMGYVAATLREHGFVVSLRDAAAEGWSVEEAARHVLAGAPSIIGVTAITYEAEAAYALGRELRARAPEALLVLGGAHATSHHDKVPEECDAFDVIVVGEGEETMLEIARLRQAGAPLRAVAGARCRQRGGGYDAFEARPPVQDLDRLPPPAYDLYPHHLYRPLPHRRKRLPATAMITSRGCSYASCTYCEMSVISRAAFRRHSPERVIQEIRELVRLTGAREIYFQDDIFIQDGDWVARFCALLEASELDIIWSCESRFVGVAAEVYEAMRRAGCWRIYFGFESSSQELLDRIRKGHTPAQARQAAAAARAAGVEVVGFFMLGLPGETPALARDTIRFATELGLAHAIFSLTIPLRGTILHDICAKYGTILQDRCYNIKTPAFLPHAYSSPSELEALQLEAYRCFYARPTYWLQSLAGIRGVEDMRYYLVGAREFIRFLGASP